jgi:hypothetical protein
MFILCSRSTIDCRLVLKRFSFFGSKPEQLRIAEGSNNQLPCLSGIALQKFWLFLKVRVVACKGIGVASPVSQVEII